MARTGVTRRDLERERARARGARRMLPWAITTAVGGGLIVAFAGGGVRGALTVAAVGLLFVAFLLTTAIVRCPACGAPLGSEKRPVPLGGAGPAAVEKAESCPRCRAQFT